MPTFLDESAAQLNDLTQALHNEDWTRARAITHSLKGSSASLALAPFSQVCKALEADLRANHTDLTAYLAQLQHEFQRIQAFWATRTPA